MWPNRNCGAIPGTVGDAWLTVDAALHQGARGLPGGPSLAKLLGRRRGKMRRRRQDRPTLTEEQILTWADAWFAAYGAWPYPKRQPAKFQERRKRTGMRSKSLSSSATAASPGEIPLPGSFDATDGSDRLNGSDGIEATIYRGNSGPHPQHLVQEEEPWTLHAWSIA